MNMLWALIIFASSGRSAEPKYVILYPTKQECEAKLQNSRWNTTQFCAPVAKE